MAIPTVADGGTSPAAVDPPGTRRPILVVAPPAAGDHISDLLESGFAAVKVIRAGTAAEAADAFAAADVACIVLDLGAAGVDALADPVQIVDSLRETAPNTPLVVLTRGDDGDHGLNALQRGAQECLRLEHVDARGLCGAVRFALERKRADLEWQITEVLVAEREALSRAVVESLEAETVVVAGDGTIIAANRRWLASDAWPRSPGREAGPGTPYLELCEEAARRGPVQLSGATAGVRAVLSGTSPGYSVEYPVGTDGSRRWYELSATPLFGLPGAIISHADISERKAYEAQLASVAFRDPLTGLPNRELFIDRLELAVSRSRRDGSHLAVVRLDLDDFKVVNDSLGQAVGDQVLAAVAGRLAAVATAGDTVGRLDGDEFAVLCEGLCGRDEAEVVGRRLSSVLDAPFVIGARELFVRASVGVAVSTGIGEDAGTLVQQADTAMYRAKELRRGVQVYDDHMRARARERLWIGTGLHAALDHQEFRLHFQPIVELASGRITGAEALLRWYRPDGIVMGPAEFVPLAEETGTIERIGRWALSAACSEMAALIRQTSSRAPLVVSVNLSATQLASPRLTEDVAWALAAGGCNPASVCLEITEGTLTTDVPAAAKNLAALRRLGVSLAIDDFGTGYSSMLYVKHFLVDALKIDRSFVAGVGRSNADTAIVRATISLAHSLGAPVIAEGVETAEQLETLRLLGCDAAQGYYFSHPLPYAEFAALHRERRRW